VSDKPYSEATARLVDAEVARILQDSHEKARELLQEHRKALDALAAALIERESLDEKEILATTGLPPAPQLPERPKLAVKAG
jgi:cell division protease FtsH